MNEPHNPNVTADIPPAPADSPPTADPLFQTDPAHGSASTDGSRTGAYIPAAPPPRAGDDLPTVPGYRVLREIARGGMGKILAAHELSLDRDVAIKVLLPGARADRFVRESKITARLPHPGIPPVYALGMLPDRSPFLAMKLITGQTLAAEIKTGDRPRLLQAFAQVCQAVGFAHSRGVIHRDLKPANVMVGTFGEVQVMDWGLAKELTGQEDAAELRSSDGQTGPDDGTDPNRTTDHRPAGESTDDWTQSGQVMGTPAYMAPEQARGEAADARTDVFALGGILCAILTGQPPLVGKSPVELIRRSAVADLAEANERLGGCGADAELVALCRRCLSPNSADRPGNGQAVADGVTTYLSGVQERLQTVERERGIAVAKAVEERRRRKVWGIAAGFLLVGAVGTFVGMLYARDQRALAETRYGQLVVANAATETERTRATQNFATARALILDLGERIGRIETGQSNPRLADLMRKQALDKAREQLDQFREGQPDDATVQRQAATLHRYAGNVSRTLNDYPAATAAYEASIQILDILTARHPDRHEYRDDLAMTLSDRAGLERLAGKPKAATATLDRALQLAEGPQGNLSDSSYRRTIGVIVSDKTHLVYTLGRFDDTLRLADRSVELFDQLKTAPADKRLSLDPLYAAIAVHHGALARRELGQTAESLAAHDDAVARMKGLAGPKATRDARYWDCEVRRERSRTAVAVPDRRAAALADLADLIPVAGKLVEENPQLSFYHEGLAATHLYRGELLLATGQPDPATAELTKSLAVSRALMERHGPRSMPLLVRGKTFLALGRARAAAGKREDAEAHWRNAAKVFELGLRADPDNFHHRRGQADAERELSGSTR